MRTKTLFALLCGVLCLGLLSCSKENDNQAEIAQAEKAVAWIKSQVVAANGAVKFESTETQGLYLHGIEGRDAARAFCQSLINENFDGADKDYTLPAEYGKINIRPFTEQGYYFALSFKVKGVPSFKLYVAHPEALNDDNMVRPQDPPTLL